MAALIEPFREIMVERDVIHGIPLDTTKIEGYFNQLVLSIRFLILTLLGITVVSISIWIFSHPQARTYRTV